MALAGFEHHFIAGVSGDISVHIAGEGPPLLLLHGYPQNHMCWSNVAPALARTNRVIVADLRGYGDSHAPESADGALYAKRLMAAELAGVMRALGHDRFSVLGHDRGGRVAYRMALDAPEVVDRLGIIEIVPTHDMWANMGADLALAVYHWMFLAQPHPLPERLISADPRAYVDHTLASWTRAKNLECFAPEALASYRAQMADPARCRAMCSDYRAGATVDRQIDAADLDAGRRITARMRFVYAREGFPSRTGDPLAHWRKWAEDVDAIPITCGHFAMDEAPDQVLAALDGFFA